MSENLKRQAALAALKHVKTGMKLGLGTGSTAAEFVDVLGIEVTRGMKVICVPTSIATQKQAEKLNIPLTTLDETPHLDLTIDGADELDDDLNLIKGGGGALLREKIVASSSARMIVIADSSKHVKTLGAFPLPIEVIEFGADATISKIEKAAASTGCHGDITLRERDGVVFKTDSGNVIYDCAFGTIKDPVLLADKLSKIPGIVDHGLFIGICDCALVATPEGVVEVKISEGRQA